MIQAHASLPHNGAGAGQAIEDAFVLGELLRLPECTRETLPQFLLAYEAVRRPRASRQQVHSRETGEVRIVRSLIPAMTV
jgi:salicylate hydroxylase